MNLELAWPADVCAAKTLTNIQISLLKGRNEQFEEFKKIWLDTLVQSSECSNLGEIWIRSITKIVPKSHLLECIVVPSRKLFFVASIKEFKATNV